MSSEVASPVWVDKVSRSKRKRSVARKQVVRVEHSFEYDLRRVTYEEIVRKVWGAVPRIVHAIGKFDFTETEIRKVGAKVFDGVDDQAPRIWDSVCAEAANEFEEADKVVSLPVGSVDYQLRRPLKAHISPSGDHGWECSVDEFAPRFIGKGENIVAARRDFLKKIHMTFQSLVQLRPFQMDDTQSADWQMLESLIDVEKYWDSVPVTLIETGVVASVTADGWEIIWLDGERRELIPTERTLPQFAVFKEGHWFEALVERQPRTYELQKLGYVRQIDPLHQMSEDEFREWVSSLPKGEHVPKSDTDWTTL